MGNLFTKSAVLDKEESKDSHEVSVEGEIVLPKDPRSPTPDINRTPIHQNASKIKKITKNVDLTKECFDKYESNVLMNPSVKALLSQIDPRSPTLDFQRTPLAMLIKNPELMAEYNQSGVGNDLDISQDTESKGLSCQRNLDDELTNVTAPHDDDESGEVEAERQNFDENSKNSQHEREEDLIKPSDDRIPGLLETNLDYIETDLDTVRRRPKPSKVVENQETVIEAQQVLRSENEESPPNKDLCNNVRITDLSNKDPRSPSVEISRTPIVLLDTNKDKLPRNEIHSKMQDIFDHNMKLQQKRSEIKNADINLDFLMIYEDNLENKSSTPVKKMNVGQKNENSRTPLACMMNIHKKIPITKIPSVEKIGNKKSKIPVKISSTAAKDNLDDVLAANIQKVSMQNLPKKNRIMDSIENTPPKPRQARWDQDNSVIL